MNNDIIIDLIYQRPLLKKDIMSQLYKNMQKSKIFVNSVK